MNVTVNLYSNEKGELNRFLSKLYDTNFDIFEDLKWEKKYKNPIELAEIIGVFTDNSDDYLINMWICIDKDIYIHVTNLNADEIIKYLYERYPY